MPRHRRTRSSLHRSRPNSLSTCLLALLLAAPPSQADETRLLDERVRELLLHAASTPGREASVEVHPAGAHLPPCAQPEPFLPHPHLRLPGRVAVGVRCADGGTRYLQATVSLSGEYPVTRRELDAGEVLTADLLELRHGDLGSLPRNSLLELDQALGKILTRPLPKGSTLPSNALRAVPLVERGARVRVEARAGGFVASREGTALDSGALDEQVRIRMPSGTILRARVRGQNLLSVDF